MDVSKTHPFQEEFDRRMAHATRSMLVARIMAVADVYGVPMSRRS